MLIVPTHNALGRGRAGGGARPPHEGASLCQPIGGAARPPARRRGAAAARRRCPGNGRRLLHRHARLCLRPRDARPRAAADACPARPPRPAGRDPACPSRPSLVPRGLDLARARQERARAGRRHDEPARRPPWAASSGARAAGLAQSRSWFRLSSGLWRIEADPNELESAILNLCVNARDAMPAGGRLTIETSNMHIDRAYACRTSM